MNTQQTNITLLKENGGTIRSNEKEKKSTGQLLSEVQQRATNASLECDSENPVRRLCKQCHSATKATDTAQASPYTEKQFWAERGVEDMRPFGPQGPFSGGSVGVPGVDLEVDEKNTNMRIFPKENLEPPLCQ